MQYFDVMVIAWKSLISISKPYINLFIGIYNYVVKFVSALDESNIIVYKNGNLPFLKKSHINTDVY